MTDRPFTMTTEVRPTTMTDGSEGWMATDPTRPGCVGYGATGAEAGESLARASVAYDAERT